MNPRRVQMASGGELPLGLVDGGSSSVEQQLWEKISAGLRQRIGGGMFDRWFARAGVESCTETLLQLRVPNLMNQYWIEDHYLPALQESVTEAAGASRQISFTIVSDAAEQQPLHREAARGPASRHEAGQVVVAGHEPAARSTGQMQKQFAASGLNSRFTFDSFVVGPNSSYAVAVARAVAEKPGKTYNPLFLHGATGLGKTHLMQAIGQEILRRKPRCLVRYVTSENFTSEYIEALRQNRVAGFRQKYRQVDVLMIDDIQFFAGKGSTQEEFFHTFNDLFNSFKQIILTSDRAPSEIKNLEERLVSRFEWGMATIIESPDLETRTAILRQKMFDWSVQLDDSVLTFLAENIRTNVRRLEGALMRVAGHVSLGGGEAPSRQSLETLLSDIIKDADTRALTIDHIQKVVAEQFDIRLADMTSHRRPAHIALPRQIAMHLARELTKSSLKEIGEAFGGKDHGTVIHACKTVKSKMEKNDELRRIVQQLAEKLRRGS